MAGEKITIEQLHQRVEDMDRKISRIVQAVEQLASGFGETQAATTAAMIYPPANRDGGSSSSGGD